MTAIVFVVAYFAVGVGAWVEGRYSARGYAEAIPFTTITAWPFLLLVVAAIIAHDAISGLGDRIEEYGHNRRTSRRHADDSKENNNA